MGRGLSNIFENPPIFMAWGGTWSRLAMPAGISIATDHWKLYTSAGGLHAKLRYSTPGSMS